MYIDTITPTLQAFNDSMQGLQQMKHNTIARKMQLADLLNRQGKNLEAETALSGARNYGLSSLFAKDPEEWQVKGAFENTPDVPLKDLLSSPDAQKGGSLKAINAVSELKKLYGSNTEALNNQLNLMGLEGENPAQLVSAFNSQKTANDTIRRDNLKAESYNKNKPSYSEKYTGNEVDQQQALINDTMKAIQNGGGLSAYNRYLATTKAIDDHYQHNNKALPPEYFGLSKSKGTGKGGKNEKVYLYNKATGKVITGGMATESELSSSDPTSTLFKKFGNAMSRAGISDPSEIEVQYGAGENTGSMNDLEKEKLKESRAMNDAMAKAQALTAWNEADPSGLDFGIGKKAERAKLANSTLGPDNPYRFDSNGNLQFNGGFSNVAAAKKPWQ